MTTKEQVVFRLHALCRYDDDVKAFVGYLPRLQVYTQTRSKDTLPEALRVTALQFILACANKGILASVMRECGAKPSTRNMDEAMTDKDFEFVAVAGYEECAQPIEVTVPLSLIARQEAFAVA